MVTRTTWSYEHGPSDIPLLGETIGHNLGRTAARCPDAEALVVRAQGFRHGKSERRVPGWAAEVGQDDLVADAKLARADQRPRGSDA